ncbi:MAG: RnfH family protein [Burkholderiales bacterium]|jgi:putative ubiquitin-RnfH superfamily antitoxin RatB of RatAB toxin-antitoxin module|nr:RnfH family protein [Burkholderiales bacterium]MCA3154349.1 RnfH family protein [Burkholderiales bacterium]MCA3157092.1 RnfH family protein [Burkholderiales bacterium]MCA3167339.1 RnfH family protein [Burkholderiales bacterium]
MPDPVIPATPDIVVTVCYALSGSDVIQKKIMLKAGATVLEALTQAGYQNLDWFRHGLGVYGKRKTPDSLLHDGDRVEIYAVLTVDPKLARQRRVEKQRREKPDRWIRR